MKIVWVLLNGGFVRNYDGAIRALAAKGHFIVLAFQTARNKDGLDYVRSDRLKAEFPAQVQVEQISVSGSNAWATLTYSVRRLRDYLRYFEPAFARATALRERSAKGLLPSFKRLADTTGRFSGSRAVMRRLLSGLERIAPPDPMAVGFLRAHAPDLLMVTPLVDPGSRQVDYVKAARMMGIPSGVGVASWDNLTNKGLMRVVPDRVFVWNEAQKTEAVEFHGARPDQVIVTGAQIFDRWFDWRPTTARAEFCGKVGLPDGRPYLLYLGSSPFIAPKEAEFAERWLRSLRKSDDPELARAAVLVRPHPSNYRHWLSYDLTTYGPIAFWPPFENTPFDADYDDDYASSIWYSAAVVGINTSAMIEAGIFRRPVATIRVKELAHSQAGTLHFEHLRSVEGGLVYDYADIGEHLQLLGRALRGEAGLADRSAAFVRGFVRPHGDDEPATPRLVAAIQQAAALRPAPQRVTAALRFERVSVYPLAWAMSGVTDSGGRPAWVNLLRLGIRLVVYTLFAVYTLRIWIASARRVTRETGHRVQKRIRRGSWSVWHETKQRLTRTSQRLVKRVSRGVRRTGSAVKQRLRSAVVGRSN